MTGMVSAGDIAGVAGGKGDHPGMLPKGKNGRH